MKPELNIAMIEDSPAHCQQLQTTLNQWAKEQFVTLHTFLQIALRALLIRCFLLMLFF